MSRFTVERSRVLPARWVVFDRDRNEVARQHNGQPSTHGRLAVFDRREAAEKFRDRANRAAASTASGHSLSARDHGPEAVDGAAGPHALIPLSPGPAVPGTDGTGDATSGPAYSTRP